MLFSRELLEFGRAYLISRVVLTSLGVSTIGLGSFDNDFTIVPVDSLVLLFGPFRSLGVCMLVD